MVLEQLRDGASRHLLADEGTRRLIFILCLPLVDGVFATLLVTGAISTFSDVIAIALTIFTGAGALAVLYSHAETRREARRMVLRAAPVLLLGAAAVALVAPVFQQVFYVERLQYAAGLALLVIAGHLMDLEIVEKLSVPAIILTGLVLSVRNPGALTFSLGYMAPAVGTALVSIAGLYAASYLARRGMNLLYVRRGGAMVLMMIAASQFGYDMPSELGLVVFAASIVVSLRA